MTPPPQRRPTEREQAWRRILGRLGRATYPTTLSEMRNTLRRVGGMPRGLNEIEDESRPTDPEVFRSEGRPPIPHPITGNIYAEASEPSPLQEAANAIQEILDDLEEGITMSDRQAMDAAATAAAVGAAIENARAYANTGVTHTPMHVYPSSVSVSTTRLSPDSVPAGPPPPPPIHPSTPASPDSEADAYVEMGSRLTRHSFYETPRRHPHSPYTPPTAFTNPSYETMREPGERNHQLG